ncbi:hydrolase [Streptomyces sp. NPDC001848]|uniref:hydrolase n=1 Tax=Streptomyces sp. NPDC001848 TaxID=3364618 RepID=UPI0036B35AA0
MSESTPWARRAEGTGLARAARRAAEAAARHAGAADVGRRLDPAVVAELMAAGFARHFVPAVWGGREGSFSELLAAVATVGEECASAAWIAALGAAIPRMAAYLPEKGQAAVWADGPDVLIVGAQAANGVAEAADGGWLVRGRWPYTSGVEYAHWALVRAQESGGEKPVRYFAVPRSGFRFEDTWRSVGMRGTGSHALVIDEEFVPPERTFRQDDLLRGDSGLVARCHQVPFSMVSGLSFAAPALGAVRGLLTRDRPLLRRLAMGPAGSPGQLALLRARGELDSAQLLLERAARQADSAPIEPGNVAQGGRDCAMAARFLASAADRLFRVAGTAAHQEDEPFQRVWRDVTCAVSHRALSEETHAAAYAEQLTAVRTN